MKLVFSSVRIAAVVFTLGFAGAVVFLAKVGLAGAVGLGGTLQDFGTQFLQVWGSLGPLAAKANGM